MLEPKASRFYQAALQSGLIDEAGLEACFALIPPEKRTHDAIDRRMARQAITTGRLTLWQAQQIMGGRSTGFKIDKYILLDLLGRGGMGRVYLARDVRLNRLVALKILSQERMNNPRAIARFQREAKVGAQLQHENLVRVYDEGEAGGVRYLVMEYIEGKNVGQIIGELGTIPWPTAARLARQIALGLEHAQLKELIHRDVNPCNILVTTDGTAKLTDLGLAIDLNDQDNVTRDGATVGTFDYVSPEQARHSRSVDTRADIYSLGCTLYHMIAGRVPFPVSSLPEKLYAHQLHEPDPLTDLVPGVPEALNEVVRKMMRKSPDERYQTPLELAQALEPFAIEAGWTATSASGSESNSASASASRSVSVAARPMVAEAKVKPAEAVGAPAEPPSSWKSLNVDQSTEASPSGSGSDSKNLGSGSGSNTSGSGTGVGVGDSFFPLDLGPDEPLREGLKPSSKSRSRTSDPDQRKARLRLIVVGIVAAVGVVALFAVLAAMALSGPGFNAGKKTAESGTTRPRVNKPLPKGEIVVVYRDGEAEVAPTLADALAMTSTRTSAEVILAGGTTLRMDNSKPIRMLQGGVTIKAADGARPVLEVKLKGSQPMFLINANLRLVGLTVTVRYETPSDAPVFQAERDLSMERCTFRAIGPAEGSRFVLAEGRKATIDGCLFEGFDTALTVEADAGMTVSLKRSIFLAAKPGDELTGRAARVRSMFGRGSGCKLSVENCSARSGMFLDAGNFTAESPLEVEAANSAFLVKALVGFEGDANNKLGPDSAVRWKGRDNRYQVAGPGWAAFPGAPADLDAWSKLTGESGSKTQPLKLAKEPPDPETPKDCAIVDDEGKPVGADPGVVGPG